MDNSSQADHLRLVQDLDSWTRSTGGGVFVSLWEDPVTHEPDHLDTHYGSDFTADWRYPSLAVNGDFDSIDNWVPPDDPPPVADEPRYLFDKLESRILYGY
jgi:hypothetical protein